MLRNVNSLAALNKVFIDFLNCLIATTRYREYFDKILKQYPDLKVVRESKWVEKINILSTARPQPPQIDYITPTFEWRKTQNKNIIRHQRL